MKTADILLHPVRMRIIQALVEAESATTANIIEKLQDTPTSSVYRQIAKLQEAGVIVAVGERPVRGVTEKTYAIAEKYRRVNQADISTFSQDELAVLYRAYLAGMSSLFDRYVQGDYGIAQDNLTFAQASFWATDSEMKKFLNDVSTAIVKLSQNTSENRKRYTLGTIAIPYQRNKKETNE